MAYEKYPSENIGQADIKQDMAMETKSINNNGCSVCEQGQENYTTFIAGAFRGTEYYQYDYRDSKDGELFSTVAKSLEECRKRRDEWLSKKKP